MINFNSTPRTNAETKAFFLLQKVARAGHVCEELSDYNETIIPFEFVNRLESDLPEPVSETLDKIKKHHVLGWAFAKDQLIDAIGEYCEACKEIARDNRPRDEILKSEGWHKTKSGWERH